MVLKCFSLIRKLTFKCSNLLYKKFKIPKCNIRKNFASQFEFETFQLLSQRSDLENHVLIFDMEKTLLKFQSLFPYFMLVAFEGGSLLRALVLFLLYPFILMFNEDFAIKVMVMVCFVGLKKDGFREGKAVLPKFFLEDVGKESFEVLRRGKKKVALSELPRVMVESFLMDYLDVDFVVGRELKVLCGYYVGLMEKRREFVQEKVLKDSCFEAIGITSFKKSFDPQLVFHCKEIYMVSEKEKRNWHQLPRDSYPKPLIFHDGRLAFKPSFWATLAMFMWLPLGLILAIFRIIIFLTLPYAINSSILHFTGIQLKIIKSKKFSSPSKEKGNNGVLYVCNHKTLLDPLVLSFCIRVPITAVTYSLSRVSEFFSPIKTVRLTRNRDRDAQLMKKMLSQGDLVVCPEGTTCREPYLLRFSPLFSEMSKKIWPVAMDCTVSMFYGTSTRGLKCLDPLFFLMNPHPSYRVHLLDMVSGCADESGDDTENSKFKMANLVQEKMAKELGFTCTKLTRKNKYLILAGNKGLV